ncbi:MAG: NACHT domain-containing protein, partial [Gammaproteobacteria bacterium]
MLTDKSESAQSEIGALVEVKGRVHDLARALAIAMPAVVKVSEDGSAGSAQAISIGELDNTFTNISSKELLEICFDKIFNESDLYIKEIQKQLADLRAELKQPDLSKEDKLDCYQRIESSLEELKNYYIEKQEKSQDGNSREQYSTSSTALEKNTALALGNNAKAKVKVVHKHITKEISILEKLEKHLTPLFIKTEPITSNKDFRSLAQQIYVEPESSWSGEVRSSLKERCDIFIKQHEQKVFVVLGDPGVGKTTFGLRYIQNCWRRYQRMNETNIERSVVFDEPLPLFIRLNQVLKDGKITSDLLESFLKEKADLTITQINELQTKPLVVFLDGYDEISEERNIYQLNHWKNWPYLKCIVSTRPEKFGNLLSRSELQDALLRAFSPEIVKRNARIPASVVISQILEFSSAQVNIFINQWQSLQLLQDWEQEHYEQSIQSMPGLSDLTSNP